MTNLLVRLFIKNADNTTQPAVRAHYGLLAGWVGIVCNMVLAVSKLLAGLVTGSIAIVADAVNNFSDMASSAVTIIGFKLSAKPADKEHPFGHARFEYIAGLAVSVMVMVIGIELGKGSIEKIIHPQPVQYSLTSLLVLAAAVGVKLWMALFNKKIGQRIDSPALAATSADSRNDAISTGAVLAAVLIARVTGLNLDGWIGLGVAVFILISGYSLVRDTLNPLLGSAPDPELVASIDRKISSYPGVMGTHDLIVHDYGPARRFASAHVEMDSSMDLLTSHSIIDKIERDFIKQDNLHLLIHLDPVDTGESQLAKARDWTVQQVKTVDTRLTIHDFRIEEGHGHVSYIFDVVAPSDLADSDEDLKRKIAVALQPEEGFIHAKIKVDRSYAAIP